MDALAGLLDGPRARGAFLLRCSLDPPFALRVQDRAPLTVLAVARGEAWLLPQDAEPVRLGCGDVAVLRGPDPYVVCDDPGTPLQALIQPGQRCTAPDGQVCEVMADQGVRGWGNSPDGRTVLLTGTYLLPGEVSRRLLASLPQLLSVPAGSWEEPLVGYLAAQVDRDEPGQQAVLDRLLDLLVIAVLRAWLARPEAQAPGWYSAHADPVVGPALHLMHTDPGAPWTVASLAAACGVSRAAMARRFHDLVGQPPMAFLSDWRLTVAADLLREPGATVEGVAHRVGYGSGFALSTAFKRVRGVSPRQHRGMG